MAIKKLVMPAAILFLGCSDAASDGNDVPAFAGNWSPPAANGVDPVDALPDPSGAPAVEGMNGTTGSGEPTQGAESSQPPASGQQASNEGQSPREVPLEGGGDAVDGQSGGTAGGPGETPTETEPEEPEQPPALVVPPLDCNAPRPSLTGGTEQCRVNASGSVDGQSWFMWYSGASGCMTAYEGLGGAFRANWNNSGDFLARMGIQWNETQTFEEIGTIGADFNFSKSGTGGGYSFIGVYGWSNDPLIEYYIVEDSFGNGPATPFATTQRGTFNVDGATYRIYSGTKTNQPSIHGTATFQQYFSVRQSPRQCGHISVSEHFRQWQSMGMGMGKMYEARVLVEAGGGSGSIDFTRARVTVSDN